METFKQIPSFPDYEISNCGRVKTISRKIRYIHAVTQNEHFRLSESKFLKIQFNNRTGYKFCQLYLNKKMYNRPLHRLIAETFLEKLDGKDFVNHKDGNKHNNTVENLEWCTDLYNHEHATTTGLKPYGSRIGSSLLNERTVNAIRNMIADGIPHSKIAKWFGVAKTTITMINTGRTWNRTP